jgi:hypothetical protein
MTTRTRPSRTSRRDSRRHQTGPRTPRLPLGSAAAFTPDAIAVGARHVEIGSDWVSSFAIVGFPREVQPGWLTPLLTYPGRLDVSVHVEPIDPVTAAGRLKKQLARLESGRRHGEQHGRLADFDVEVATEDAYDLAARVARGEGRLFRVGLYLTVHATSQQELADEVAAVRALCASLLLDARHTTYRSVQGWVSTLPMGLDLVGIRRTMDTAAIATAYPFTSPDLPAPDPTSVSVASGVLYGHNLGSQSLVYWDRFAPGMHNHNMVVLGRSGAGKSFFVKMELLRSLYRGIEVLVIDPEDEYRRLCDAVGGTYLHLGAPGVRINPFDLPIHVGLDGRRTAPPDALVRRSLFLHTLIGVLLGADVAPGQRAALDRGIAATYQSVGITADVRTWTRPAPTLRVLRDTLAAAGQAGDTAAEDLAARLHPFVDGAFGHLFDGPSSGQTDAHLTVFSLRDLPDELRAVGTLLVLDAVWRRASHPTIRRPRLVVVDEGWLLMQDPTGARYLFRMAKSFRKLWAGLTIATQDVGDVLSTETGKAIISNAATQVLLRQAPQVIDDIVEAFDLSAGMKNFLLTADKGHGLLCTGTTHTAFSAAVSPQEYYLLTTSPSDLAEYAEDTEYRSGEGGAAYIDLGPASMNNESAGDEFDTGEAPDRHIALDTDD